MAYWLMKTEPSVFGIDDLKKKGRVPWDGVRNYAARNFLRDQMRPGDGVLVYHSSCPEPGVAGLGKVAAKGYPDALAFDPQSKYFDPKSSPEAPRWFCVDIEFKKKAAKVVPLEFLRQTPETRKMELLRLNRLSITPVRPGEWAFITGLAGFWKKGTA